LALSGSATIAFPRAYLEDGSLDFSFSGLKSAVLNYINNSRQKGEGIVEADVAASFQAAVVEVLVNKTLTAAKKYGVKHVCIAGGVSANKALRSALAQACDSARIQFYVPDFVNCTDNAAMVGAAAYYRLRANQVAGLDLNAHAVLALTPWSCG